MKRDRAEIAAAALLVPTVAAVASGAFSGATVIVAALLAVALTLVTVTVVRSTEGR